MLGGAAGCGTPTSGCRGSVEHAQADQARLLTDGDQLAQRVAQLAQLGARLDPRRAVGLQPLARVGLLGITDDRYQRTPRATTAATSSPTLETTENSSAYGCSLARAVVGANRNRRQAPARTAHAAHTAAG